MRIDIFHHWPPDPLRLQVVISDAAPGDLASITAAISELKEQIMSGTSQLDAELATLRGQVEANTSATQSAVTLMNGIGQRIQDAVAAAMAAGATAEELQAVTDLGTAVQSNADALGAAVAANTPAAP